MFGYEDATSVAILRRFHGVVLEAMSPRAVMADGNCMYRAASLALYGHEDNHHYLRLITAMEIIDNPLTYDSKSSALLPKVKDFPLSTIAKVIRDVTNSGSFSEMVHVFALSAAIGCVISSYMPLTVNIEMNNPYTRLIAGRGVSNPGGARFALMWTALVAPTSTEFMPNHFVYLAKIPQTLVSIRAAAAVVAPKKYRRGRLSMNVGRKNIKNSAGLTVPLRSDFSDVESSDECDSVKQHIPSKLQSSPNTVPVRRSVSHLSNKRNAAERTLRKDDPPVEIDLSNPSDHQKQSVFESSFEDTKDNTVITNEMLISIDDPAATEDGLPDLEQQPALNRREFRKQRIENDFADYRGIPEYKWYQFKPDLIRFMNYFNNTMFDNRLPVGDEYLKIARAPTRKYQRATCAGNTHSTYTEEGSGKIAAQIVGLLIDPQQCDAKNKAADEVATLLHECIHAYMKIDGSTEKNDVHGPVFMACVNECVNLLESTNFYFPGPSSLFGQGMLPLHPRFQNIVITRELVIGGVRNIGWSA